MKKVIIALAAIMVTAAAYGQGSVNFSNRVLPGIDAKVLLPDKTGVSAGFIGQLYAGAEGTAIGALKAVPTTTTFRTGAGAGYLSPITVEIPGIAAGAKATIVLRVYDGASFESAKTHFGTSNPITIALGGVGVPPSLPANLDGLQGFTLTLVPEPSTIALAILGAAAMLFRRRK